MEHLEDINGYADISSSEIMEVIEAGETPCQATSGDLIKGPLLLVPKAKPTIKICFIHPILLEYSMRGLQCSVNEKLEVQDLNRQSLTDLHRYFVLNIIKWHIWLIIQKKLE